MIDIGEFSPLSIISMMVLSICLYINVLLLVHYGLLEEKLNFDKKEVRLKLSVKFFLNEAGSESVRDWLKSLPKQDSRTVGADIKTVKLGWPLGVP